MWSAGACSRCLPLGLARACSSHQPERCFVFCVAVILPGQTEEGSGVSRGSAFPAVCWFGERGFPRAGVKITQNLFKSNAADQIGKSRIAADRIEERMYFDELEHIGLFFVSLLKPDESLVVFA